MENDLKSRNKKNIILLKKTFPPSGCFDLARLRLLSESRIWVEINTDPDSTHKRNVEIFEIPQCFNFVREAAEKVLFSGSAPKREREGGGWLRAWPLRKKKKS